MSELNVVGKELTMVAPAVLRSGRGMFVAAASLVAVMAVLAGCSQESKTQPQIIKREPPQTASELLDQVVEAYHQADSYQDAGRLLVRYSHDGKDVNQSSEFSLALAGPSRLRMRAYHALVVCDGETFYATIDEAPGEVLSFPAPEELSPSFVYKDPVLANALNQTAGSVPLSLYLDPDPLPALLLNAHTPQFDPPQKIGDDNCYRVRIEKREGPFVLWIDQQTLVVRRVEYPTSGYRRLIEPYIGPIADLTITAELEGARLDPSIDDATFRFEPPSDAEPVQWFEIVHARWSAHHSRFARRKNRGHQVLAKRRRLQVLQRPVRLRGNPKSLQRPGVNRVSGGQRRSGGGF
jgi:outer membrane lipoprotein-sorting protein